MPLSNLAALNPVSAETDPAFAAIEGHRAARAALIMTTPTTLAGSVALMRYIAECQPLDVPNDGCGPVFWEGDENKVIGLMARVADYVEKHVT